MIAPIPDRPEIAAVACEGLAEQIERAFSHSPTYVQYLAGLLDFVPITHPERLHEDRVLAMAAKVRDGTATADELRALAVTLRAGRDAMLATGWTKTLAGCP